MFDTLKLPDDPTPGDLFRAIADWYDANPQLHMPTVTLNDHHVYHRPDYATAMDYLYAVVQSNVSDIHHNSGCRFAAVDLSTVAGPGRVRLNVYAPLHAGCDIVGTCHHPSHTEEH